MQRTIPFALPFLLAGLVLAGTAQADHAASTRIAPDIRPAMLWDGRKDYDFHAADQPRMVHVERAAFLSDDEYVLGVTENGESRAYPTRFLAWHHIVNDRIGAPGARVPVTLTYCVVCNTGMRFDPVVNGRPLHFDFYGLYNGVMTMYDRETKSVWLQVGGRAVKGTMTGSELHAAPSINTTWGRWKELHPETLVMAPVPQYARDYAPNGMVIDRGVISFPAPCFRHTLHEIDSRLPAFEMVLAVAVRPAAGGEPLTRAYTMRCLQSGSGIVRDRIGATPVAALYDRRGQAAAALSPVLAGRELTLVAHTSVRGDRTFYDRETGSRWTVEGRAVAGPLAGRTLRRLDCTMSEWYGWSAYYPQTTIYSASAPGRRTGSPPASATVAQR